MIKDVCKSAEQVYTIPRADRYQHIGTQVAQICFQPMHINDIFTATS